MTELDIIVDNIDSDNLYLKEGFYQLVMVNNYDIFNIKKKIKLHFFKNYNGRIFVNLELK